MPGSPPSADEFFPLPWFPWDSRPDSVPLTDEEIATALFLDHGQINKAAERLRVEPKIVKKAIRRSFRLKRLLDRLADASEP